MKKIALLAATIMSGGLCIIFLFQNFVFVNSKISKEAISEGYTMPIVIINTNGQHINEENQIIADFTLKNSQLDEEVLIQNKVNIKFRGSSSKTYPKKQFGFEFINDLGEEKKVRVLDMSKDSDWVLNGPFADKSLIRNYLAYNVASQIMEYSPKARYCEVYLLEDGEGEVSEKNYKGLYLIIEKIKRNEERVDIDKSDKRMRETGFIIARDRVKVGDLFYRNYGSEIYLADNKIVNHYPKDPTEEQKKYITNTLSNFERSLYSDRFTEKEDGYQKYIDVDSFIDYYIINELFKNTDSGIFSTYFYQDLGGKLCAGPVWDFNAAFGNYNLGDIEYNDPTGFYMAQTPWFSRLLEDTSFVAKLNLRYKSLRSGPLSYTFISKLIDDTVNMIDGAIEKNFKVWPFEICNQEEYFRTHPDLMSKFNNDIYYLKDYIVKNPGEFINTEKMAKNYGEEINMLKEFVKRRGEWMDENIRYLYKFTN